MKVRILEKLKRPDDTSVTLAAGVVLEIPENVAKRLIDDGRAEKVEDADTGTRPGSDLCK